MTKRKLPPKRRKPKQAAKPPAEYPSVPIDSVALVTALSHANRQHVALTRQVQFFRTGRQTSVAVMTDCLGELAVALDNIATTWSEAVHRKWTESAVAS